MTDGTYLSWEEAHRLALPPNTAMLMPPPKPLEVAVLAAGPPLGRPDWLDDDFQAVPATQTVEDADANRAAAERAEYGPGPVRLLANVIAFNALREFAASPREDDEDDEQPSPGVPRPKES